MLREIVPEDYEGLFAMDSDKEVHLYLGNNPITDVQQAKDAITNIRQQYIDNGIGRWAVIEKQSNEFIGWSGLKLVKEERGGHSDYYDVGYRFAKKHWGKGYATETAMATVEYGFNNMDLATLNATADRLNKQSIKVLTKAGLNILEEFVDSDGRPYYWFELRKADWKKYQVMFTIEQIKEAHSKVKSGADFPQYVQDIKMLGVIKYETYVEDGHAVFHGDNGHTAQWDAKYDTLSIGETSKQEQFISDLKAHQRGETNYPTFCNDCAKSGVEKWIVDINKMTCTYYDKAGNELLVEQVPQL